MEENYTILTDDEVQQEISNRQSTPLANPNEYYPSTYMPSKSAQIQSANNYAGTSFASNPIDTTGTSIAANPATSFVDPATMGLNVTDQRTMTDIETYEASEAARQNRVRLLETIAKGENIVKSADNRWLGNSLQLINQGLGWFTGTESDDYSSKYNVWDEDRKKWFSENGQKIKEYLRQGEENIADTLYKNGFKDAQYKNGRWTAVVDGKTVDITPSLLQTAEGSKYEIFGSIGGGIIGLQQANKATAGVKNPWVKGLSALGGTLMGGYLGSSLGRGADLMYGKMQLQDELDAAFVISEMADAGIADAFFTVVGGAAAQTTAAGFRSLGRGAVRAWDLVVRGNEKGALDTLLMHSELTPAQAEELVQKFIKLNGPIGNVKKENTFKYKALDTLKKVPGFKGVAERKQANMIDSKFSKEATTSAVIATTTPGLEGVYKNIVALYPEDARGLSKTIRQRAKQIGAMSDALGPIKAVRDKDNLYNILNKALEDYTDDVTTTFQQTKALAQEKLGTSYTFDFDSTVLEPLAKNRFSKVRDQTSIDILNDKLIKIRDSSTGLRDLSDLLDTKVAVNKAISDSGIARNTDTYAAVKPMVDNIEKEIEAASNLLPNGLGKDWYEQWKFANQIYSEMSELKKKVFVDRLKQPALSNEDMYNIINKMIRAEDNSFNELLDKLPKHTRNKVEGAAIQKYSDLYTWSLDDGTRQATNFPSLSRALNDINLQSPEALQFKRVVDELAEVFKSDADMMWAAYGHQGNTPTFQSFLTTNAWQRAKYEMASSIFNYAKAIANTQEGRVFAQVRTVKKVIKNPTDIKAINSLLGDLPADVRPDENLVGAIKELQNNFMQAKNTIKGQTGRVDVPEGVVNSFVEKVEPKGQDRLANYIWQNSDISVNKITQDAESAISLPRLKGILSKVDIKDTPAVTNILEKEAERIQKRVKSQYKIDMPFDTAYTALKEFFETNKGSL